MSTATEPAYLHRQVCELAGITYRQLDHWDTMGVVSPSVSIAQGSGTRRRYSWLDIVRLATVRRLREVGVSLDTASTAVRKIETATGFLVAGTDSRWFPSADELVAWVMSDRFDVVAIVSLDNVVSA